MYISHHCRQHVLAAFIAAGLVAHSTSAVAQGTGTAVALSRLTTPIHFDGAVDEPAWLAIAPVQLTQFLPNPGGPAREPTEIRLAYDDQYIYASGRFTVSDPSSIRANSMQRDVYAEDDYLNLIIDTFGDRESAVWFLVTPNGTRVDGAISNDAEGPESQWNHQEYDMMWDAVTQRTSSGWSVEVRIPLSTLRYEVRDGRATMGIITARLISRGKERYIYPAIRPTHTVAQFKPSLAARVTLEGIPSSRMHYVAPYVLFGSELRPAAAGAIITDPSRKALRNIGGDLKLGLSSQLTLDLTANTDFAQTEVDDQRVNLSRFSLFFPEKRQFFLERSGVFDFTTGGDDRMFYSRRVGLGADDRPVRVLGGGRLVGRVGGWDVGALDMQMDAADASPGENAAIVRVRRSVWGSGSYIGAMATAFGRSASSASTSAGVDGTLRVGGEDYVIWSAAVTNDSMAQGSLADRSVVRLGWERRRRVGWQSTTSVSRIGDGYAPALGYVQHAGIAAFSQKTAFGWFRQQGRVNEQSVDLTTNVVQTLATHTAETVTIEPGWNLTMTSAASARLFVRARREVLADTFRLSPRSAVVPGTFRFGEAGVTLTSSPGSLARVQVDVQGGGFYDGRRVSAVMSPTWNPSSRLELAADAEMNRVWLGEGREVFRGDVGRLRGRFSFDPRMSLTGSIQYNRAAGVMTSALRFRRNVREGTDLYVVLNDARGDEERSAFGFPSAARAQYLAVKYVRTLR